MNINKDKWRMLYNQVVLITKSFGTLLANTENKTQGLLSHKRWSVTLSDQDEIHGQWKEYTPKDFPRHDDNFKEEIDEAVGTVKKTVT